MECHERIRALRIEHHLTQKEAGEMLKIPESTYRSYELGRRQFPLCHLLALGKYFDCSLDFLSGASNVRKPYPER